MTFNVNYPEMCNTSNTLTAKILNIIHRPVDVKHDVSENGFCLRL
jgi:hypothetical protein